ncbi:DNA-binding CsgD family transcriptional regulator [Mesorhizobium sp. BE184]|nr:DNA-binding CsgD family transcriptional regulator [Mesorhizobium sp. BE184]
MAFLREARGHGIRSGFTIPIDAAFGRKASVTFSSMKESVADDLVVDPYTALSVGAFLDSFVDLLKIRDVSDAVACPLTPVQLECLSWTAEGKANQDVAILCGVTRRAVESQLHHVRQRLDVLTTCQAVAVAVRSGWL